MRHVAGDGAEVHVRLAVHHAHVQPPVHEEHLRRGAFLELARELDVDGVLAGLL